jgi:hypothetical protein
MRWISQSKRSMAVEWTESQGDEDSEARRGCHAFEAVMSDEDEWDFAGAADAKVTIHAAARYLLKSAGGSDRGDIISEIIEIVRQAAQDVPLDRPDPFDDDEPGG